MGTQLPNFSMSNGFGDPIDPFFLTPGFPPAIPPPKYQIGTRCRWIPMQKSDWGKVIGHVYAPKLDASGETLQWSWVYFLLLDADSPSRGWLTNDWVDEEDLEIFPAEQTPSTSNTDSEAL